MKLLVCNSIAADMVESYVFQPLSLEVGSDIVVRAYNYVVIQVGERAGVGCVISSDRGRVVAASFRSDFGGDLGSICNPIRPRSSCPKVVIESDAAEVINRIHKPNSSISLGRLRLRRYRFG
ncbi:uncharacterized protein G2W53_013737 [Senna tora]|uniref:Uncharacterized protein n=1 Tax=Senna tora TaxID=362788 RepID=A0A834U4N6_9FABA|nr:uncharacterized protein G2W53_013737 [Senna tora]